MFWLTITISSYLLLAIASLADKYLLSGPVPNSKVYAFYMGILGIVTLFLVPFIHFYLPQPLMALFSFISGSAFIIGTFWFFKAIKLFELSRIVPAVGSILPIFTFLLFFIFSGGKEDISLLELLSFIFLIGGSFLITFQKKNNISFKSFKISIIAAFFFAIFFVFAKYVYISNPFLVGLVWIRIFGVLSALCFLLSSKFRTEIFKEKITIKKRTALVFLSGQTVGVIGNVLQNWAVALVPIFYVAFINALQGIQYVFLIIISLLLSLKFPQIFKEEISKGVFIQKMIAILLIGVGLILMIK